MTSAAHTRRWANESPIHNHVVKLGCHAIVCIASAGHCESRPITMKSVGCCCRVLDALSRSITKPGIFEQAEHDHFLVLFQDAISQFEVSHEATYMGRNNIMRRFFNRQK